jgi:hypothetical protein
VSYAHDYTLDPDATDCGGHGTNVASIAAGLATAAGQDAQGYRYGLGVAPYAEVGASKVFRCNGTPAAVNYATLTDDAWAGGARISNNSWGSAVSGAYNADAREFDALVRDSLTPDGVYLANIVDSGREGPFVQAFVNTLRSVFADVAVYALDGRLGHPGHATFVVAASNAPLDPPAVPGWTLVPADRLAEQFAGRTALVLTDDHAPVDTLLRAALDDR